MGTSTTLTLSPTTWSPGSAASYTTITVTSNTTWSTPTSNQSWLTVSGVTPTNRTGNGSFRLDATANTGALRTATVTVTGGGFTRTVTVTQAAGSTSGDRYEPNNTLATATSIANNATITDANIHVATDVDYYKFTLTSTSSVTVNLSNIPSGCDYDLKLHNSAGTQVGISTAASNNPETITMTLNAGTYYIQVYPWTGLANNYSSSYYRLALTTTAVSAGDRYEP
ncbi:MAG: pre-peptidase C-terminal domain-containing protein, partial [Clostridiales bacterium]|nr:pre-peptidase C-terminal domain-containing protein [Clostridiales bacterium]